MDRTICVPRRTPKLDTPQLCILSQNSAMFVIPWKQRPKLRNGAFVWMILSDFWFVLQFTWNMARLVLLSSVDNGESQFSQMALLCNAIHFRSATIVAGNQISNFCITFRKRIWHPLELHLTPQGVPTPQVGNLCPIGTLLVLRWRQAGVQRSVDFLHCLWVAIQDKQFSYLSSAVKISSEVVKCPQSVSVYTRLA